MFKRLSVSPNLLIVATGVFLGLCLNTRFYADFYAALQPASAYDWAFMAATAAGIVALYVLVLTIFALPYVLKPVIVAVILLTAGVGYFMREYGVVIDVNMIRNAVETDAREVGDLINGSFFFTFVCLGVVPAVAIALVPIDWPPPRVAVARNFRRGFIAAGIVAVLGMGFFATLSSFMRENKHLLLALAPGNAISATARYVLDDGVGKPKVLKKIALDARRGAYGRSGSRPAVVVLVIGETARADRFSLNGYARNTNPELQKIAALVSYRNARSCGTDTAQSVPCIFSGLGRSDFSNRRAAAQEDLLDIVQRLGYGVLWRENQSGCKGTCLRVPTETLTEAKRAKFCNGVECHDAILADGLDNKIRDMKDGGLIVLHMKGSHGPAYFARYPSAFRTFTPTCDTSAFSRCSTEEISNAYDNTIVYTDHVLAEIVRALADASSDVDTAMLYASDHGESLGEHGIYLHGMPYSIAPKEQTHIPMLLWLSESYAHDFGIARPCLAAHASAPVSHDNIFPTVLAMLDIKTAMADGRNDLLAPCRTRSAAAGMPAAPALR